MLKSEVIAYDLKGVGIQLSLAAQLSYGRVSGGRGNPNYHIHLGNHKLCYSQSERNYSFENDAGNRK